MNRKRTVILIHLAMFLLVAPGLSMAQTESDIAAARAKLQADRQAVVAANLTMTETEAAAFWPVYREYRAEAAVLGDEMQKLITTYAKSYNDASMTDEQGMSMTKDYLRLKKSGVEIRQKYLSRFAKIIPGKSVMRFYQIENKLDVVVEAGLASEIPLAE